MVMKLQVLHTLSSLMVSSQTLSFLKRLDTQQTTSSHLKILRRLQKTLQLVLQSLASQHSHQQVWMDHQTGDSRHTLLTFLFTSSIRRMAFQIQRLSREHTLTTTSRFSTFTSTTQHAHQRSLLLRQVMTLRTSL